MRKNNRFAEFIDDETLKTGATFLGITSFMGVVDVIALIAAVIWMNKFTWFVFWALAVVFFALQVLFHVWKRQAVKKIKQKVSEADGDTKYVD